jgi:hypothetical protein
VDDDRLRQCIEIQMQLPDCQNEVFRLSEIVLDSNPDDWSSFQAYLKAMLFLGRNMYFLV